MIPTEFVPISSHLWQSTLFAGAAALLTLALRRNQARVRHAVWLAASYKFLIPFSWLVSVGHLFTWRSAPSVVPRAVATVTNVLSAPVFLMPSPGMATATEHSSILPFAIWSIWACGFLVVSAGWAREWWRIRVIVKTGKRVDLGLAIPVVSVTSGLEPGVFGIFRPTLLLPEGIAERLTPEQLRAVIAHELCHLRHRDNFVATIQMFIETVFWFHPLVWWIGKRMLEEREGACDEEVLRTCCQPKAYADAVLRVCRLYAESPLPCVTGVTGADLKKRMKEIMANRKRYELTRGRKLLLAGAAVLALTVPAVIGLFDVSQVRAQSAEDPTFEVASVKLHVGGVDRNTLVPPTALPGGRFVSRFPLPLLISWAYRLPFNPSARVTGIPDWVRGLGAIYDVEATSEMPPGLSVQAQDDRVRAMVRAMLVDRFKLVIHRESKEMPVYALVVAKGGPKLLPAEIDEKDCPEATLAPLGPISSSTPVPEVCHAVSGGAGRGLHAKAVTISDLAAFVENWTDRPLLDKTGIRGLYRFDQTKGFLPMNATPDPSGPLADEPTVFEMFEALGLKMVPQKGMVDVYVIEHLEKPSAN
jgi:bla regulator protein blaR1